MPAAFYILFGAVFTLASCIAAGRLLLKRLSLRLFREEETAFAFVLGSACLSLAVFALAAAGLARKGVFLALGILLIGVAVRAGAFRASSERFERLPARWKWGFTAAFLAFTYVYFFNAMAPEMSPDGSGYQLGLVGRYYREHGFHAITTNMYAGLSQGVQMLFLFAYAFGRNSSAAMVHFGFLLTLALLIVSYGRRLGMPRAGLAAALLTYASPVVGVDGTSAYVDVAVACIVFSLFYLLQIWRENRSPTWLIPIGLLAGYAYAAKYTAFLAIPYALGLVALTLYRARERLARPLLVVTATAALMVIPWMAKNVLWLGNPFSPFFNKWFRNPYVLISFEREYLDMQRHLEGAHSWWEFALEPTLRGQWRPGIVGPVFLLAPLALVALRRRAGRRVLLAAAVFGSAYFANVSTRFLIPCLPFVSLGMAMAAAERRIFLPALLAVHCLASWPAILGVYANAGWQLHGVPVRAALRLEQEDTYLANMSIDYVTARMVERGVPPGGKVFAFNHFAEAYTTREVTVGYRCAECSYLMESLWMPLTPDWQPTRQWRFRFPPARLRKVRVIETAPEAPEEWKIAEFRICRGGRQLMREPQWRLTAHPYPWVVEMAFDGRPITRWRSGEPLHPGMYVEADFGGPETVDSITLELSPDQTHLRLRPEGVDAEGRTVALAFKEEQRDLPPPKGLRRQATLELKARGIDYLVTQNDDFGKEDFYEKRREWGITLVDEVDQSRLYRMD